MNERIKELALIAVATTAEHAPDSAAEMFAELIVRECMKCSDQLVSHYIDTHTEKEQALLLAAIADYSSEIRKHFGFEE